MYQLNFATVLYIMKLFFYLLAIPIFFTACNNREKDRPPAATNIDAQEKKMQEAINKYPDSLLLKENLIQYYRDNGNYDMAIGFTNNCIKADSNNFRLWDIIGTLYYENEDTAAAINAYEKAIVVYPDMQIIMSLGSIYAQTKNARALNMADALLHFDKAHSEKEALFIKGLYYNYTGEKLKAITYFDSCLSKDYTFMVAYREKGIALYDMGKYDAAITLLDKAVTLQNNFDEGYYWMGRCFEKLNKVNEAIEQYQMALQYDPEFIEAREALGRLGVK